MPHLPRGLKAPRYALLSVGSWIFIATCFATGYAPELADAIMRGDPALRLFDLRAPADFARMHIPGARGGATVNGPHHRRHPEAGMLMRAGIDATRLRAHEFARLDATGCAYLDYAH